MTSANDMHFFVPFTAGMLAGITGTALTHPLDTIKVQSLHG